MNISWRDACAQLVDTRVSGLARSGPLAQG
jgi:hypothetical protein